MASTARVPWLTALLLSVALTPASASHTTFSSSVDRFEVDGNVFGPSDGVLDFVDEFDDGTLAPEWSVLLGSATEAGGVATMHSPGTDVNIGPVHVDTSNIEKEDDVQDGAGNFTATSYWVPALPGTNQEFHMQLYGVGSVIESAGLQVTNMSPEVAAAKSPPGIAGYAIGQVLIHIGPDTVQSSAVALDPADVTGAIVFRLSFDDATNALTASFSLDGGVTFQSPFPPMTIFQGVSASEILLGAATDISLPPPVNPPCGSVAPTSNAVLRLKHSIMFRGILGAAAGVPPAFNPAVDGAEAVIASTTVGGMVLAPSIPGGPGGCGPLDGWLVPSASGYRYRNRSNALPPSCAPGSAQGLRELTIRDRRARRGQLVFKLKAESAAPLPQSEVLASVTLGSGNAGICGSATFFCANYTGGYKCIPR
jgi:hypothetical protein